MWLETGSLAVISQLINCQHWRSILNEIKKTIFVQRWRLESFLMGKSARRSFSCTNFAIRYVTCLLAPAHHQEQEIFVFKTAFRFFRPGFAQNSARLEQPTKLSTEQIIWRWIQAGNNTIFSIKYLILNFKNFETLTIYFTNLFTKMTSQNGSTSWNRASVCD